jgi:cytochrome c6
MNNFSVPLFFSFFLFLHNPNGDMKMTMNSHKSEIAQIETKIESNLSTFSSFSLGKQLFFANCNVCHISGKNLIIPEKDLKRETLEMNGMNNFNSIIYQITNGKNGMPAFGGRLTELQINELASYVLEESIKP